MTFTPAYKGGSKPPYGVWDASDIYTTKTWQSGGKLFGSRRDIAGAILRLNDNGKKISYVVGWLGFHWGDPYPREQYYHFLGYPAKPSPPFPSDGSRMFSCEGQGGSTAFPRPFIPGDGPDMQTIPCDMGEGASGAPWITDFSPTPGQTDFLHGNGALLNPLYSGEVLSPYFDATAGDLWGCLLEGTKCSNLTHQSLGLIAGGGK